MAELKNPNILVIWGDRHHQLELLQRRSDGLSDAQHRSHRPGRHEVHRLVRGTVLHGRTGVVHHGFAQTFREYPPRQKAASFTIDDALAKMAEATGGGGH